MSAMYSADFTVIKKKMSNALIEIWRLKIKISVSSITYCQTGITLHMCNKPLHFKNGTIKKLL